MEKNAKIICVEDNFGWFGLEYFRARSFLTKSSIIDFTLIIDIEIPNNFDLHNLIVTTFYFGRFCLEKYINTFWICGSLM